MLSYAKERRACCREDKTRHTHPTIASDRTTATDAPQRARGQCSFSDKTHPSYTMRRTKRCKTRTPEKEPVITTENAPGTRRTQLLTLKPSLGRPPRRKARANASVEREHRAASTRGHHLVSHQAARAPRASRRKREPEPGVLTRKIGQTGDSQRETAQTSHDAPRLEAAPRGSTNAGHVAGQSGRWSARAQSAHTLDRHTR